jgi:hypothetical protein
MVMKRKPSLRTTPAKKRTPIVRTIDGRPPPRAVAVGPARPKRVGKAPVRRTKGGSKDMGSTSSSRKQNTQSTRATRLAQAKVAQAQRAASRPQAQKAASTVKAPVMGRNQRARLERAALKDMRRKRRSV